MNTKSSWIILTLLILAIIFVPIIPNDTPLECKGDDTSCDNPRAYTSLYDTYMQ